MSFITTILLFHIISFIKIKCQNLSFKIQIKQGTGNKTYSIIFPLVHKLNRGNYKGW